VTQHLREEVDLIEAVARETAELEAS